MLKSRQVEKITQQALATHQPPLYEYLGHARGVHYLRHLVPNAGDPEHNLLALSLDEEKKIASLRRGVSYFDQVAQLAVAPSFSRWSDPSVAAFRSKQTARRALEKMLASLASEASAGFASVHRALRDTPQLREAFVFFQNFRAGLAQPDSPARQELKQRASSELYQQLLSLSALHDLPRDADALDAYLDALGGEGAFQGTDAFTLNRDKALRKLSDYQLGDPVLFPLFLAVGLALAGARSLEITIDSDETWVRFEGTRLPPGFLEEIPSRLLASSGDRTDRALAALGRALLQGAEGGATALTLETAAGVIDLSGFPESFPQVDWGAQPAGTFYRRQRFGIRVARRYLQSRSAPHSEIPELLSALPYLGIPWTVNGQSQDGKPETPPGTVSFFWSYPALELPELKVDVTFDSPVPAAVLFRFHPDLPPGLTAVQDGMVVELPGAAQASGSMRTNVLLFLPDLSRDLSGRRLVETQLLSEIMEALPGLHDKAWTGFAGRFAALSAALRQAWVGPLLSAMRDPALRVKLHKIPLLPRIGEPPLSLHEWGSHERRLFTPSPERFPYPLLNGESVVAARPEWVDDLTYFEPSLVHPEEALQQAAFYNEKLADWRAEPESWAAPRTGHDLLAALPDDLGWLYVGSERHPPRELFAEGRPLPYTPPASWAPPYVGFRLRGEGLAMDWEWKSPVPAERLEAMANLVAPYLPALAVVSSSGKLSTSS